MLVFETQKDFELAVRAFIENNLVIVAERETVSWNDFQKDPALMAVHLKFNDEYAPYNYFTTTD